MANVALVGGQEIALYIRLAIDDRDSENYEYSNEDLSLMLGRAVDFYSRYRPYVFEYTLTTVANQRDYAAPSGKMRIKSHNYRSFPSLLSGTYVAYWNAPSGAPTVLASRDWGDEALNRIRMELVSRLDDAGRGVIEETNYTTSYASTSYLRLCPTPTDSGTSVTVGYTATHPLQNNNYFTIPAEHAIYLQKLVTADVLDMRANGSDNTSSRVQIGTTNIQFGQTSNSLRRQANALRQEVSDALSSPVGAVG